MAVTAEASRAWIGLGANLGDPAAQVREAMDRIARLPQVEAGPRSSLYRSAPHGTEPQGDYCNAVCEVRTRLAPERLLEGLQFIEQSMGRQRDARRWSARLIDLDLLHFEGAEARSPRLTLPHPELARRNFVLVPLAEIAPQLELPELGRVDVLAETVGREGLARWPAG